MDSCSSSMEDEHKFAAKTPALEIFPLASTPFNFIHRNPFLRQPFSLNPNFLLLSGASYVVREIQKSIVSNVDKCLKMMDVIRCQNGVLDKVISFSSHLQSCCQIPRRKCQNMHTLSDQNFAAILPGDSVAGVVVANGIFNFINIYNTLLIVRIVLTWFPNAPPAVVSPLSTLCDPYLNIFRGIIPPLGGTLDLSPILAFLVLNAFQSTAAALPAELPPPEASKDIPSHLTTSQKKWMKRFAGNKSRRENGEF